MIVLGEIDCRESILTCVEKGRYSSVEEGIETVIGVFVVELLALIESHKPRSVYLHPVVPSLDPTRHLVEVKSNSKFQSEIGLVLIFLCRCSIASSSARQRVFRNVVSGSNFTISLSNHKTILSRIV
jgi:hypothetical protein